MIPASLAFCWVSLTLLPLGCVASLGALMSVKHSTLFSEMPVTE